MSNVETVELTEFENVDMLIIDNLKTNQHWQFCADELESKDGRWLHDDELEYNNFEFGPEHVLTAGTRVKIGHLWGYYQKTNGLSNARDYAVVLPVDATVESVVWFMLSQYHSQLKDIDAVGRFFYIEAVSQNRDGDVEIYWGT